MTEPKLVRDILWRHEPYVDWSATIDHHDFFLHYESNKWNMVVLIDLGGKHLAYVERHDLRSVKYEAALEEASQLICDKYKG